jgi:hypothetical protein
MGDVLNRLKSWGRVAIATLGVMLMLWLVIFVRPDRPEVGERTEIKLWSVTGSEDIDPPGPKWFNESQDAIYLRPVGLPFMDRAKVPDGSRGEHPAGPV